MKPEDEFGPATKTLYTLARIYDIGNQLLLAKPTRWQRVKRWFRRLFR